jgi:hypothetical protein
MEMNCKIALDKKKDRLNSSVSESGGAREAKKKKLKSEIYSRAAAGMRITKDAMNSSLWLTTGEAMQI